MRDLTLVKVTAITSVEVASMPGVRLEIASIEPSLLQKSASPTDTEYVSDVTVGVMTGLQQAGIFPKYLNTRLILSLTMQEYEALGRPQINDMLEMVISKNRIELNPVSQK